ncbi:hypothetical protein BJX64DRAFT_295013 [Aspergillus heterothallicus]
MKLTALQLTLVSALPNTLLAFSDACRKNLVYCGSTLMQYNGYTAPELRSAIPAPAPVPYPMLNLTASAAYARPEDARFRCVDDAGVLALADFCAVGCMNPPDGDICAVVGNVNVVGR